MSIFTKHDISTAPEGAAQVLAGAKERYGFVPNLAAYVAEAPNVLGAVLQLAEGFDNTTLTPQEQQVVLLTVSALNGCEFCKTVHTALGKMAQIDENTIQEIIAFKPLKCKKLDALRTFTQSMVEEKAWLSEDKVQDFLNAGYTKAQVFEVVMGIALKTLTNYSNHLAGAEPNEEFVAMAEGMAMA